MYEGHCRCGRRVWSNPTRASMPTPFEMIICPDCGTDCSISPGFRWRVRYLLGNLGKRRRVYGVPLWIRMVPLVSGWLAVAYLARKHPGVRRLWRMPREVDDVPKSKEEVREEINTTKTVQYPDGGGTLP